jgi:hypothetical protein
VRTLFLLLPLVGACREHSAKENTPADTDNIETTTDSALQEVGATDDSERIVFKDMTDNEAAPLFERKEVIEVRLSLPSDEWDKLLENARDEEYTVADVTIMGQRIDRVGLRIKGAVGSLFNCFDEEDNLICDKLGMKLKFNEYVNEQRFLGLKRLNLQSWVNDSTKMHECLAYDIFREMDIVAPRCTWAYVFVNDEPLGLFGLVERVDGRFTDSRFEEGDGNLYKEAWPAATEESYFKERLKTNEEEPVIDEVVTFSEDMTTAKDSELPETLGRYMDLDYILRYMAVDFAIANWDGITTFYCNDDGQCGNHNYYLYEEEFRPFFWLIPWDLEASLFLEHWLGDIEPWNNLDVACDDFTQGNEAYRDQWTSCLFEAAVATTPQPEGVDFKDRFCEYAIACDPDVDTQDTCDQQFATDQIGLSLFLETQYIDELDACLPAEPTCDDEAVEPCLEATTAAIIDKITLG